MKKIIQLVIILIAAGAIVQTVAMAKSDREPVKKEVTAGDSLAGI
jgi:hypothetical protein